MQQGKSISYVTDNLPPLKSPNTDMVCAWITCGGQPLAKNSYVDTIEQTASGPRRTVMYCMDGDIRVDFPGIESNVSFEEFRRRWLDDKWLASNTDHPITFLKYFSKNLKQVREWLRDQKPAVLVRRGNRCAYIPADCSEAKTKKILSEL